MTSQTWPDFEKLFKKRGNVGDGWWCWCMYHHRESDYSPGEKRLQRAEWEARNQREQQALVSQDSSHGVIVYSKGEPIGWGQYGSNEELPRYDNVRAYKKLGLESTKFWRITCFVVDKDHRGRGVSYKALEAVLATIKRRGGGLVEAYPVIESDQGPNYLYSGTVSMFRKAGFKVIAPLGPARTARVVMQKIV